MKKYFGATKKFKETKIRKYECKLLDEFTKTTTEVF